MSKLHTSPEPPQAKGIFLPSILPIVFDQPLQWLALGFKDFSKSPWLSTLHGLVLAMWGGLITWLAHDRFWLLAGSLSGFMVVAPVLATSLYAMSRAIERGEQVNFQLLVTTWSSWQLKLRNERDGYWCLVRFGFLLALAATGWVVTSSALITLFAPVPIESPMDFVHHIVLSHDHALFELWLALGGLMAAPVFASSVISMPLLLDRKVTVIQAVLSSWKAVIAHPLPMAFWAFLIMAFTLLGIFSMFFGLILIVPMLGHGSWHAYRQLIDVKGLEERLPASGKP
jgi:uncharacterized membrane protein